MAVFGERVSERLAEVTQKHAVAANGGGGGRASGSQAAVYFDPDAVLA